MEVASPGEAQRLAQEFVREARAGRGRDEAKALAQLRTSVLARDLAGDQAKLAFWLNVYNGYVQLLVRERPEAYARRGRFFARRRIVAAGHRMSLNGIEHGMLRRSMFGYSLGYISNPLPGRFERRFRLAQRDPRVHFALNCGARSCPPISFYAAAEIDHQLNLATEAYLASETQYDAQTNSIVAPRILSWFRGDFGGRRGIIDLLVKSGRLPADAPNPRLTFANYDWTLSLDA